MALRPCMHIFYICAAVSGPKMAVFQGSFSESVPFLKQPTNLDGSLPGDVGFDPLGFSEVFDVKVLREAELKHGRIAMLAVLGWIVQETAPASIHPGFPTVSALLYFRACLFGGRVHAPNHDRGH